MNGQIGISRWFFRSADDESGFHYVTIIKYECTNDFRRPHPQPLSFRKGVSDTNLDLLRSPLLKERAWGEVMDTIKFPLYNLNLYRTFRVSDKGQRKRRT